jgi:hypothetical protein
VGPTAGLEASDKGKTSATRQQWWLVAVVVMVITIKTMITMVMKHNSDFLCNYPCHLKTIMAYNSLTSPILSSPHDHVRVFVF